MLLSVFMLTETPEARAQGGKQCLQYCQARRQDSNYGRLRRGARTRHQAHALADALTEDNEDPLRIGIQSYGEVVDDFTHWLELAH